MGVLHRGKLVVVPAPAANSAGILVEHTRRRERRVSGTRAARGHDMVRVFQGDLVVPAGTVVQGDVVNVGGSIELEPNSVVQGDAVSILGSTVIDQGAVVLGDTAAVLGERPRPRFVWFLAPALFGLWLVNQPHPLQPTAHGLRPVIESLAAAVLWAGGTVLGRYMGRELEFQHILSLRFFFGLVASAIALPVMGAKAYAGAHDSLWIAYYAIATGLISLALYYYGLRRTPAVLASLAELTYPAIAVLGGIYAYNAHLRWSQWLGVALIITVVSLLPVQRRRSIVAVPRAAPSLA